MAASAYLVTRRAFRPLALAAARLCARTVPQSQKACRYVLLWYFQALRQNVDV